MKGEPGAENNESLLNLFKERGFAHPAILEPDRTSHAAPIWIDGDAHHFLLNLAKVDMKGHNIDECPSVALTVIDSDDLYPTVDHKISRSIW